MSARSEVVAAYRAGVASWDQPGRAMCPHDPRGSDVRGRVLAEAWAQGRRSRISLVFRQAAGR